MSKKENAGQNEVFLSEEQKNIAHWLKKLRFRRALFGVNERHVWKKIAELDEMYQQALKAERIRYDALLEEYRSASWNTRAAPPDDEQEVVR